MVSTSQKNADNASNATNKPPIRFMSITSTAR